MKTIPVEQLDERLTKALEQQGDHEAIGLTKGTGTVAWLLRVPPQLRDYQADAVQVSEGPEGYRLIVVQAKHVANEHLAAVVPVFGAGRGTLTIISEDDDHLKDFQEYME